MAFGLLTPVLAQAGSLEFGPGTILVYETQSATKDPTQFVIRIARFQPDIVLEWETVSYQGTTHMFRAAVRGSRKIMTSGVFDPGVDTDAEDWMVKWLSRAVYEDLVRDGEVKLVLNNIPARFELTGRGEFPVKLNGDELKVRAVFLKDDRRGTWKYLDDPKNPIVLEYETPYYRESLRRVATDQKGSLRWIKRLPPVK